MANAIPANSGKPQKKGNPTGFNGKSSAGKTLSTEFISVPITDSKGKEVAQKIVITHR